MTGTRCGVSRYLVLFLALAGGFATARPASGQG